MQRGHGTQPIMLQLLYDIVTKAYSNINSWSIKEIRPTGITYLLA